MTSGPMTMHDLIHPDDERLSALAAGDSDATTDADLQRHVAGCDRCELLVSDLRGLRSALAELPDLTPSRPLRLLPPTPQAAPAVEWVRRAFAPALVLGGAMLLIGAVGLGGRGGYGFFGSAAAPERMAAASAADAAGQQPLSTVVPGPAYAGQEDLPSPSATPADDLDLANGPGTGADVSLVLLAGGLVLIAAALVLRYVVVPRAG